MISCSAAKFCAATNYYFTHIPCFVNITNVNVIKTFLLNAHAFKNRLLNFHRVGVPISINVL